jgi:hypothetical protein
MSGNRNLPDPATITRQPGQPSVGGSEDQREAVSPEQAVEEARQARETAERERDAARSREQATARERDEAQRRATDAGSAATTAHEQALDQSIQAQTSLAEQAKNAIATSQAAGDHIAVADAFDKLAEARATLRSLNDRKAYLATQKTQRPNPEAQQQQRQDAGSTVTTPGGSMQVAPAAKQWMDSHQRFYSDAAYYNHAVAAHSTITNDGIQEGTPAYFRALDEQMTRFERFEAFERGDQNGGDNVANQHQQPRGQPQRQRAPASSMGAPVSRGTAPAGQNNGQIDPLRVAQRLGPAVTVDDLREYARINGYGRDETGFQKYLKDQEEIYQIDRAGGDTGLRYDGVYR